MLVCIVYCLIYIFFNTMQSCMQHAKTNISNNRSLHVYCQRISCSSYTFRKPLIAKLSTIFFLYLVYVNFLFGSHGRMTYYICQICCIHAKHIAKATLQCTLVDLIFPVCSAVYIQCACLQKMPHTMHTRSGSGSMAIPDITHSFSFVLPPQPFLCVSVFFILVSRP